MAKNKTKNSPQEKVYWRSLAKNCRLYYNVHNCFIDEQGALVYWHGHEAIDAQRFLKTRVRIG